MKEVQASMKRPKLSTLLALVLSVSVAMMGCSSQGSPNPQATAEGASQPKIEFRYGYEAPIDHHGHKAAQHFAEVLNKETNGRIKVKLFPAAQLGGARELMTSVMNGSIEMVAVATFGTIEPKMLVTDMPYMFRDFDHVSKFVKSEASSKLLSLLNPHGVHGMGYWSVGFRNIGNTKRPVSTPQDLDGLLIRAFENEMLKDTLTALGANVTVLPYPEVYMALQTGTINGEENPYVNTVAMKFYEGEKYKTETRHMNNFNIIGANLKWWNTLSREDQDMITKVFNEATDVYMQLQKELEDSSKKTLIEKGMTITEIKDYKPWEEAVKPVYDKWEPKFGADLIQSIRDIR